MSEAVKEELISVKDCIKQLNTTRPTLYSHLKKLNASTVKRHGKAFLSKAQLSRVKSSLTGDLTEEAELSTVKNSKIQLSENLTEVLTAKLTVKDDLIQTQKEQIQTKDDQIKALNLQISEIQEALSNQQKLSLMDKQILVNLQTDIQLLENKNKELTKEQGSKKILNIIQLVAYLTITGVLLGMTYIAYQAGFYGLN